MAERQSEHLDHVFHALAHPVRRQMLRSLAKDAQTISQLGAPLEMSLEAVSKHVQVLERAQLVQRARVGRAQRCTLSPGPLGDAAGVLAELGGLWNKQLDSLDRFLAKLDRGTST
jgi:DNA-binding transcriptional ArsR family regulator